MPSPVRVPPVLWMLLLSGCTAMGQWLYDDPSFALRGVSLHHPETGSDSLELVFVGCNLNDYEVTSDSFETRLAVAGQAVASGSIERPVHLPVRDSSRFSVMLALAADGLRPPPERVRFEVAGTSALRTPIGTRNVIFRIRGKVRKQGDSWEWVEEAAMNCRPGLSALPPEFSTPIRREPSGSSPRPPSTGDRP